MGVSGYAQTAKKQIIIGLGTSLFMMVYVFGCMTGAVSPSKMTHDMFLHPKGPRLLFGQSLMQGNFPLFKTITKNLAFVLQGEFRLWGLFWKGKCCLITK